MEGNKRERDSHRANFEVLEDPNNAGKKILRTCLTKHQLLKNSILNKGTAFSQQERDSFGLNGLLPPEIETLEIQQNRMYQAYQRYITDIQRHIFLRNLQDVDETVFYRLLTKHIAEMLPIVYTPTVGQACERFHEIYRQPRGLFISYPNRDKMDEMISNINLPAVKVIVVSDGERILGLEDQEQGRNGDTDRKNLPLRCLRRSPSCFCPSDYP